MGRERQETVPCLRTTDRGWKGRVVGQVSEGKWSCLVASPLDGRGQMGKKAPSLGGETVGIRWGRREERGGKSGMCLRWRRSGPDQVPAAVRDVTEVAQARRKVAGSDGEREGSVMAAGSPGRGGYAERCRGREEVARRLQMLAKRRVDRDIAQCHEARKLVLQEVTERYVGWRGPGPAPPQPVSVCSPFRLWHPPDGFMESTSHEPALFSQPPPQCHCPSPCSDLCTSSPPCTVFCHHAIHFL